jgi:Lrp/AsnC family leucine-responsive transcriptional regulator
MKNEFDRIDRDILMTLQSKGRVKLSELADMTDLSVPSVSERLKKLEDDGIITGYRATVSPQKLGYDVTAFIVVTIDSSKHYKGFISRVAGQDEIIECHAITGEGTHMVKVRVKNTSALERLLSEIQSWQGVTRTMTSVVLSSTKETTAIPVPDGRPTGR